MRDAVQRSGLNEKKKSVKNGPQRRRKEACMCACARTGDAARSERTTVHFLPCTPQHRLSLEKCGFFVIAVTYGSYILVP